MFWNTLPQVIVSGLTTGVMYAFIAVGFTVVFNSSDVINFAQGDFAVAAGIAYVLIYHATHQVGLSLLAGIVVGSLLGAGTYKGVIQHARRPSVMSILIITFGVSTLLEGIMLVIVGPNPQSAPPLSGGRSISVLSAEVTPQTIWIAGTLVVVSGVLFFFFNRTSLGLRLLACAIDRRGAALIGVDVGRTVFASWIVSSALAALAGILVAPIISVTYNNGLTVAVNGFAAAVLAGMGRVGGALIGGLIVGLANAGASGYLPTNLLDFQSVAGILLMMIVLVVRPSGLFGGRAEARHTAVS